MKPSGIYEVFCNISMVIADSWENGFSGSGRVRIFERFSNGFWSASKTETDVNIANTIPYFTRLAVREFVADTDSFKSFRLNHSVTFRKATE